MGMQVWGVNSVGLFILNTGEENDWSWMSTCPILPCPGQARVWLKERPEYLGVQMVLSQMFWMRAWSSTTTPAAAWAGARGIPANSTVRRHQKQRKARVGWFSRWGRALLATFKQPEFDLHLGGHPPVQARHIWRPAGGMVWVEFRLSQQGAIDLLDTYFLLWGDRENGERGCPTALSKYAYTNSNNPSIKRYFSGGLLLGTQIHWFRAQQDKF